MEIIKLKIHHQANDFVDRRRREYPEIGEQLDAIFKLVYSLQLQGQKFPPDVEQWVAQCLAVKEKYPAA